MQVELVEAWTGPIDMQLKADGVGPDLTGTTVALILRGNDDALVDTSGDVSIIAPATAGKVRYSPGAADLVAAKSPYRARWKVTDAGSKVVYFPNGTADQWIVRSA